MKSDVETTMIVLIDAEDVKFVFPSWPDHICLAACLSSAGTCSLIVFRRDERNRIPARLVKLLGLNLGDVCFVPQVNGYQTRQFLYSDERRLMALVASDAFILEEAIDYAVNYNYALEEGLDPDRMLGLETQESKPASDLLSSPAPVAQKTFPAEGGATSLVPEFMRRSVDRPRRPMFASRRGSDLGGMLRA